MEIQSNERFAVILALQSKQMQQLQGSYLYEIYDKAIDLALNPKRQFNTFFRHNLFRDAKRTFQRQKESAPEFVEVILSEEEENSVLLFEEIPGGELTPLDEMLFREYYATIYAHCRHLHSYALDVLDFVVAGADITSTSRLLGLTESLVKKIRTQLKNTIHSIIKN